MWRFSLEKKSLPCGYIEMAPIDTSENLLEHDAPSFIIFIYVE